MSEKEFDIRKRTLSYSGDILCFTKKLPRDDENIILKKQLIRSGTSIGANVYESNGGHTKKDFANFMNIALKSANETIYWLELLSKLNPSMGNDINELKQETEELAKIIAKISINARNH